MRKTMANENAGDDAVSLTPRQSRFTAGGESGRIVVSQEAVICSALLGW